MSPPTRKLAVELQVRTNGVLRCCFACDDIANDRALPPRSIIEDSIGKPQREIWRVGNDGEHEQQDKKKWKDATDHRAHRCDRNRRKHEQVQSDRRMHEPNLHRHGRGLHALCRNLRLECRDRPGHGDNPDPGNARARLSAFIRARSRRRVGNDRHSHSAEYAADLYGIVSEQSVPRLFLAGILPGLLQAAAFFLWVLYEARRRKFPIEPVLPLVERLRLTLSALPALPGLLVRMVRIYGGFVAVTEAGAVSAVVAPGVSLLFYRGFHWTETLSVVIFTHNMEIGLVHPPVGLNLFVLSSVAVAPMGAVIRGILPFLLILLLVLTVITYAPELTLWLPNTVFNDAPRWESAVVGNVVASEATAQDAVGSDLEFDSKLTRGR